MDTEIRLTIPQSWNQLDSRQLTFIYRLMADEGDMSQVKVRFLMNAIGAKAIYRADGTREAVIRRGKCRILIRPREIAVWITDHLAWIDSIPAYPVRIHAIRPHAMSIRKYQAVSPLLEDISFESYITVDNYYQGYLHTSDPALLAEAEKILYPGIPALNGRMISFRHINIFRWIAAFKEWAASQWPDFLRKVSSSDVPEHNVPSARKLRMAIDAQIRALTKGDITKEDRILALPCHRALTELNALAKEAEEIARRLSSSGSK